MDKSLPATVTVSSESSEAVRLAAPQIDQAAAVLARAFFDDPHQMHLIPDAGRRARLSPGLYRGLVCYALLCGDEVYTTPGTVKGIAAWMPPGESLIAVGRWFRTGLLRAALRLSLREIRRAIITLTAELRVHERCKQGPHWYLALLGVEPPHQGQGIGGALIQPTLARADAEGLPCYLETGTEKNVRFYQRHGFGVIAEETAPGGGPRFWAMSRPPQR
jgi:GNAT superfamily N-acetyltransferase